MEDTMSFNWTGKRVLVTGGASFIGSHLVDALINKGAHVRVVDDLTSGSKENLKKHLDNSSFEFITGDLREGLLCRDSMKNIQIVFHIAADHGGRGYVETCQSGPASNLFLDGLVFWEAVKAKVEKVIFASSGCVYPNHIQTDIKKELYLTEEMVGPPYDADNMYGWAKLMAELTLRSYYKEFGLKAACCRYFTVYGPRGKEDHAIMAMIARAFIKQDPFEIWGNGEQLRNWTYVQDIVEGTILAAEKIDDGTAVNLGTTERIRVIDAVDMINTAFGYKPEISKRLDMPVGPVNRIADNSLAKRLIGWEPRFKLTDGLKETIEWYCANRNKEQVKSILSAGGLLKRKVEVTAK
jgi:nucleoside-diphosphate-sugar epimerase